MQSGDEVVREVAVSVPKLRAVSGREAMGKLFAFLQAVEVDCELDASGTVITYGPKPEGPDAEGPEGQFIQGLINLFDARLVAVHTTEEKREAERRFNRLGS